MSRGYVYILTNEAMPDLVKIGMTTRSVEARVHELNTTGVPLPFEIYSFAYSPDCAAVEAEMHQMFSECRLSGAREFFRVSPVEVDDQLRRLNTAKIKELVRDFDETLEVVCETHVLEVCDIHRLSDELGVPSYAIPTIISELKPDEMRPAMARHTEKFKRRQMRRDAGLGPGSLDLSDIENEIKAKTEAVFKVVG